MSILAVNMSGEELFERLKKVAKISFETDDCSLESNMDNLSEWDSLNHLRFIAEVEKEFSIKMDFEDTLNIVSAEAAIKIIKKRQEEAS